MAGRKLASSLRPREARPSHLQQLPRRRVLRIRQHLARQRRSSTTHPCDRTITRRREVADEVVVVRRDDQRAAAGAPAPAASRRARRGAPGSSDAVGSSISSSGGSTASARAIATRCASPPDSSRGSASARCADAERVEQRPRARARRPRAATPCACTGASQTLSIADRCSKRQWNWNTMPTLRAQLAQRRGAGRRRPASATPSTSIVAAVEAARAPAIARRIVVLPEPDSPISATSSPRATSRLDAAQDRRASPRRRRRSATSQRPALMTSAPSTALRAAAPARASGSDIAR